MIMRGEELLKKLGEFGEDRVRFILVKLRAGERPNAHCISYELDEAGFSDEADFAEAMQNPDNFAQTTE